MTRKMHKLTAEQVAQLQHANHGKDYYDELVNYMTRSVDCLEMNIREMVFVCIVVIHRNS